MGPGPQRLISDMGFCGAYIQAPMNERWLERERQCHVTRRGCYYSIKYYWNIYFNKYRKTHFDYKTWNPVQYSTVHDMYIHCVVYIPSAVLRIASKWLTYFTSLIKIWALSHAFRPPGSIRGLLLVLIGLGLYCPLQSWAHATSVATIRSVLTPQHSCLLHYRLIWGKNSFTLTPRGELFVVF